MRTPRALAAADPLQFGRARLHLRSEDRGLSEDARLFATTFAAGFLFVSILIA
ncbi:MAG TPA: hypothetical protein VMK31_05345 [Sphingomicrobium sp.]|nr:hypothetical protein [Sphingomicrobium sp.]